MNYDWREDIIDLVDGEPTITYDEKMDLFYRAAERIVDENGADYYEEYGTSREDAIQEEMANIIGLYAVDKHSMLYRILIAWYGNDEDRMLEEMRDAFEDRSCVYFVTGCNYDVFDKDLLGGNGDGRTKAEFEEFVANF